jgi:hypothetical protein
MKTIIQIKTLAIIIGLFTLSIPVSAQFTTPDSVCAGTQDVVYGILNPVSTSDYTWYLSDPAAGAIDSSQAPNDSIIQIDWGITTGTYTLNAYETTSTGCIGDTITLDITIRALPTIAIVGDSVCSGELATMTVTLTGQAPWTVDYTDGTNTFSTNANSSPHTFSVGPYTSSQTISITGVVDSYSCAATGTLPTANVGIVALPSSGTIFHY